MEEGGGGGGGGADAAEASLTAKSASEGGPYRGEGDFPSLRPSSPKYSRARLPSPAAIFVNRPRLNCLVPYNFAGLTFQSYINVHVNRLP